MLTPLLAIALTPWFGPGHLLAAPPLRPGAAERSAATHFSSIVHGVVLDHERGVPLPDAAVTLAALRQGPQPDPWRFTDQRGRFAFANVAEGTYTLSVELLGFQRFIDTVQVAADTEVQLVVEMSVEPIRLEPIVATVPLQVWRSTEMRAFEERRGQLHGTFVTRDEIEQRNPFWITDLLRDVPGAIFESAEYGGFEMRFPRGTTLTGGACYPDYWVDGVNIGRGVDAFVPPEAVEAIEVYRTLAEIPIQYRTQGCAVVLIWTRGGVAPEERAPKNSMWKAVLGLAGVVGLVWLLGPG